MFESTLPSVLSLVGFTAHESTVLAHIVTNGPSKSRDIEIACNLRQPEVNKALNALLKNGWVVRYIQFHEGRGRPHHIYQSLGGKAHILTNIKENVGNKVEEIWTNYHLLEKMLEGCSV